MGEIDCKKNVKYECEDLLTNIYIKNTMKSYNVDRLQIAL